jgi:hypothetical protein
MHKSPLNYPGVVLCAGMLQRLQRYAAVSPHLRSPQPPTVANFLVRDAAEQLRAVCDGGLIIFR